MLYLYTLSRIYIAHAQKFNVALIDLVYPMLPRHANACWMHTHWQNVARANHADLLEAVEDALLTCFFT
jgi:hypothetical protein